MSFLKNNEGYLTGYDFLQVGESEIYYPTEHGRRKSKMGRRLLLQVVDLYLFGFATLLEILWF